MDRRTWMIAALVAGLGILVLEGHSSTGQSRGEAELATFLEMAPAAALLSVAAAIVFVILRRRRAAWGQGSG
ncbi:MAG: hypothetical protein MPJ06_08800 [Nitrosopumilus sp.]|nr:hypothetical protein [Nitrosopumilus sp.]MDA7944077.1 hypothetical protein [Nitrosopumilus sp.]MDA7999355.1 hypothetical protein [Nitrosopumilus sp.]